MPDIVEPTIPQYPEQGIQATLDLLYLWNPDVIQPYIEEFERLVEEMRELLENLPEVAITGSYDDLIDKPAIDGVVLTKNTTKEELGLDIDLSDYRTAADQDVIDDRLERLIEGVDDGLTALENVVATKASQAALQEAIANLTGQIDTKASKAELEAGLATKQDVIQFSTMPTASADNLGKIVQYVGEGQSYLSGSIVAQYVAKPSLSDYSPVRGIDANKLLDAYGATSQTLSFYCADADNAWFEGTEEDHSDTPIDMASIGLDVESGYYEIQVIITINPSGNGNFATLYANEVTGLSINPDTLANKVGGVAGQTAFWCDNWDHSQYSCWEVVGGSGDQVDVREYGILYDNNTQRMDHYMYANLLKIPAGTATYHNGYIYKCEARTTSTGVIGFEPTKIGFDYTNHSVEKAFSEMTQDPTVVTKGTFVYDVAGNLWTISGKNADDQDIFTGYRLYTEDIEDLGFVMLNPMGDYSDGETLEFEIVWTSATSYDWVRIDVQPNTAVWGSISGTLSNQTDLTAYVGSEITAGLVPVQADITDIQALIPAQASTSNQLADKNFVNSSVATNTAYFIGTFNSVAELEAYSGTLTNNDYAFVISTDQQGNTVYNRYKYNADTQQWIFEYSLNNSSFTADQWAAINSNATAAKIAQIETNRAGLATHIADTSNPHSVTKAQVGLGNVDNTSDLDKPVSTATQAALNAKQNTLTAGDNITITNNVISAADGTTVTFRTWEANE